MVRFDFRRISSKIVGGEEQKMVILTREQLEERLAALHRASLELVGDLSLETVLERIANLAREQVGARYAALGVTGEDGELARFIHVGMTPEEIARMPHTPKGLGLLGVLAREQHSLRVADIQTDPRSVGFPAGHPDMHSFLGMPILRGEQHLGQIYLTDKLYNDEFTESDERVLEILAAYAAVAISNARLFENVLERDQTLTERNEDLALVNDIGTVLACSLDMDDVLESTLKRVMAYLKVEAGEIFLRGDNAKEYCLALHHGPSEIPFWVRDCFKLGEGIVGKTAESAEPLFNVNPAEYVRFLRREMLAVGFRCFSLLPLMARAEVVGVMVVATYRECMLGEREINLLLGIANWAGITIENARLLRQDRRLAVLEERERIGMDLHDGIIQSIYGVGLALDYVRMEMTANPQASRQKIEQAIDGLNKVIRDIRSYILDLRPRQFGSENLKHGLQRLVAEFEANSDARANLVASEDGLNDLPTENALALFHICQEALANIAKHSEATKAEIRLWSVPERALLEIVDNGQGFDLRKMSVTLGHGLSNMHARARKVGGDVEITSGPGEGTMVFAWVPKNN
jgi:two-component system, NarL family, sensor histidine kinase DevS